MRHGNFVGLALAATVLSGCVSARQLALGDQSYYYKQAAVSNAVQAGMSAYQAYLNIQMGKAVQIRQQMEVRFEECMAHISANNPNGYAFCRARANGVVQQNNRR